MSEEETDYGVWRPTAEELEDYKRFHELARYWPKNYPIPSFTEWKKAKGEESPKRPKQGMVLVPRKPTKAMLKAAAKALSPERRPTKDWMSVSEKHAYRYEMMIKAYLEENDD